MSCPYLSQINLFSSSPFCFSFLIPILDGAEAGLAEGEGGKLSVSETGGWKNPWGRAQAGMSCCYPMENKRHAEVTLFLLMPSCLLRKPVGEELE